MRVQIEASGELGRVALGVVGAVLAACEPGELVRRAWPAELDTSERVVLIAAGKGSVGMARAACGGLGDRLRRGVVIGPDSVLGAWVDRPTEIEAFGADHPLATGRNVEAAGRAMAVAQGCGGGETLLTLISGGASAYLTMPGEGLGLDDIRAVTDALLRSGATIGELNCVRKHLEAIKGGGLARAGGGAGAHWSLILSDVLGDPLDVIGSGPTAPDASSFQDAVNALRARGLLGAHPGIGAYLMRGAAGAIEETSDGREAFWDRVRHRVVGNNAVAVECAATTLSGLGFEVIETRLGVTGEASEVGLALTRRVLALGVGRRRAVVWGGETTVTVGGASGLGGRSQELALAAAGEIDGRVGAGVIAFGTDGIDGPTDAAGGVVDGETGARLRSRGVEIGASLADHDSHRALGLAGGLIRTGASGTNVNDVMIGLSGIGGG